MSENKENKAIENNNPAMQRPGSAASMTPEIVENKADEIKAAGNKPAENKAPLQDIDSPFKAAPEAAGNVSALPVKPAEETEAPEAAEKKEIKEKQEERCFQRHDRRGSRRRDQQAS